MKYKILLACLSIMIGALSAEGQQAQRLTATKANEYGLTYTLPLTALDITVEAEMTESEPGEFYKYAGKYLNVSNPISQPAKSIKLKSITLSTHGEPNSVERYLITLKGGQSPYIMITEDNLLLAVNTPKIAEEPEIELPSASAATPSPLHSETARQVVTEEMLMSHSTSKRAELAAKQIYEIRQTRSDLLTGQADQMPPDGHALKMVMDNLDKREQSLTAMFTGATTSQTVVKTLTIVPEDDISNQIICRLSALDGIVEPDNLSGAPVMLSLEVKELGKLPVNDKGEQLPFPKGGIAYVIPGTAKATVTFEGKEYADKLLSFSQFGVVYGMAPSNFTDKKAPVYLIVDPATGAILEIGPVQQ